MTTAGEEKLPVLSKPSGPSLVVQLSLVAWPAVVEEGETAPLRFRRDGPLGPLSLELALSSRGDAIRGNDYALAPADDDRPCCATVDFRGGERFAVVELAVLDDVAAEADETLELELEPGEGYAVGPDNAHASILIPRNDFVVTTTADAGEGSLRQAVLNANAIPGPDAITLDSENGPFATPQTIELESPLPGLVTDMTIDGYTGKLWVATGVSINGRFRFRPFTVARSARVTIKYLTVESGSAKDGGAIANHGTLVLDSVTLLANAADDRGGGLANFADATVINSTFAFNRARNAGGGLADIGARTTVTNSTFSDNIAGAGAGLYSSGRLLVRNTILANSRGGLDCLATGELDPASTRNLIETNSGCGTPVSTEDPHLQSLGYFNGPTRTYALLGGSKAINAGDNAAAVNAQGEPLVWDQRGNGDPRFVAGYTDIGAFEYQRLPVLSVDTVDDTPLRGCTRAGAGDCPLRGAIELANATPAPDIVLFDPRVFAAPQVLMLRAPLPEITYDLTLDATGTGGVRLTTHGAFEILPDGVPATLALEGVQIE